MRIKGLCALAAVALTAMAFAVPARAETIIHATELNPLASESQVVNILPFGSQGIYAGIYRFDNGMWGFCIEMDYSDNRSHDWTLVDLKNAPQAGTPPTGMMGEDKANQIKNLWAMRINDVLNPGTGETKAQNAAAFQLAVWEIVYDSDLSLSAGSFQVTAAPSGTKGLAQDWLDALDGKTLANLKGMVNSTDAGTLPPGVQDYVVAVPVPAAAWASFGMLGLLGIARMRKAWR